jgi:type I restriction enzyme, S subunit
MLADDSWPTLELHEIVERSAPIVYGILQPGPNLADGVPYVRPSEMHEDGITINELRRTSPAIAKRYTRSSLSGGDVILSIVGTIGKVAVVPQELSGANINQSAVRIRPRRDVMAPEFLAWFLRSPIATVQSSSHVRFSGSTTQRRSCPVPENSRAIS